MNAQMLVRSYSMVPCSGAWAYHGPMFLIYLLHHLPQTHFQMMLIIILAYVLLTPWCPVLGLGYSAAEARRRGMVGFWSEELVSISRIAGPYVGSTWVVVKIMVPFWGPSYNTAPSIEGTQKGTLMLTTTHTGVCMEVVRYGAYKKSLHRMRGSTRSVAVDRGTRKACTGRLGLLVTKAQPDRKA